MAPLLPKLRGQFAEFLNKDSPVRLRIFFSSTCVGLRYGHRPTYLAAFLASVDSSTSHFTVPYQRYGLRQAYFTTCLRFALALLYHSQGFDYPSVSPHHLIVLGGIGFSTDCPSSTPFGLDLGPDLPWADEPSPGNLRLSTERFLASLSLLMPAFSLLYSPLPLPLQLLPVYIAPLPIRVRVSPNFGVMFQPR